MAIDSVVVTKKRPTRIMPKLWNITFNMVCEESSVEVINQDYSVRYREGEDIEAKEAELQALMQADIDKWNAEDGIFDHSKMDTVEANLNTNLAP